MSSKIKLLFVCVENANRSQMSQAFARIHGGDKVEAYSAGSKPSGVVNPKAIAAMQELGYVLIRHDSKSLQEVEAFMGCGDACPFYPGKIYLDWKLQDPAGKGVEDVRPIRDEIQALVENLIAEIDAKRGN